MSNQPHPTPSPPRLRLNQPLSQSPPRIRPTRPLQLKPLQLKPLQLKPPPHLQLQPTPRKHLLPTPHPLTLPVILGVAKDPASITPPRPPTRPIQFPQLNSLGPKRQQLSPTTHPGSLHPLRNVPRIGTPTASISTTTAASSSTANPFRINTYTAAHNC